MSRSRAVPSGRLARLAGFGQLAGGVVGGALAEGVRRLAQGQRPSLADVLLTPANALRTADQLARLRGAAMKLGQMLSLDAGDLLPPELASILSRLREAGDTMPPSQLNRVLAAEWGRDWRGHFARFDPRPLAAASIGQVHRASLHDGREVAVKVQYPGVAASIDADIDNVATLLRLSGLLPDALDIAPLLAEAKLQLHEEADYRREAEQMRRYGERLAADGRFVVPAPVKELSGRHVLVMDYIAGAPIETLAQASQTQRNAAMAALFDLVLQEIFAFDAMQTDPNFANYRWQAETGRIVLLDFGAARAVLPETRAAYRRMFTAGLAGDRDRLIDALVEGGFVGSAMSRKHRPALAEMVDFMIGHLNRPGLFDFADRSFVGHMRNLGEGIARDRATWHVPPAPTLFVQRKVSGTALLAVRLKAQLPLRDMVGAAMADDRAGAGETDPQALPSSQG